MLYHCEYLKSRNDNIIILSVLIFELLGTRWEKHKLLNWKETNINQIKPVLIHSLEKASVYVPN